MKEHIYLDRTLVNSYLAQLDSGLLLKEVVSQSETDTHLEEGGGQEASEYTGQLGVPGIANGSTRQSKTEIDKYQTVFSKSNNNLIETALDDYSLDLLISKLDEQDYLKYDLDNIKDGQIFIVEDNFDLYNFETLQKSTKKENMENIMTDDTKEIDHILAELEKITKTATLRVKHKERIIELQQIIEENNPRSSYDNALKFANYAKELLPNTNLVKVGNFLSVCEVNNFKVNDSILTFLSQTHRKITLLGIVIFKKEKSLVPEDELESNEVIATAPAVLSDIMLQEFHIIDTGDYFVRPLSLYFNDSEK